MTHHLRFRLVVGATTLLVAFLGACSGNDRGSSPAPTSATQTFTDTTLANGLRVILAESPGSGLIASTVFIRAGAVRETAELNGAAHFLEHLLFNGTTTRTQEQLYADVDRIGAYNNAATRKDYAVFMFVVGWESAEEGLGIQADMIFNSTLPVTKFEKERGIVMEEIAKDLSDPSYQIGLEMSRAFFAGTSYEPPVLGTESSIRGLDREKVLDYYHRYYVPNNMTMLVLGDLDSDTLLDVIDRTFGAAVPGPTPSTPTPLPELSRGRRVFRPMENATREVVLRVPAPLPEDPDYAALELLSDVLAGGDGSRLRRSLDVEPKIPVQDISCGIALIGGRGFLDVSASIAPDVDPDALVERVAGELDRLAEDEITRGELAAARVSRRSDEAKLRQQIHYYGFMRGELIMHAAPGYLNEQIDRYRNLTRADLKAAASRWLDEPPPLVVAVGPGLEEVDTALESEQAGFVMPGFSLPDPASGHVADAGRGPRRTTEIHAPRQVVLDNGLTVIVSSNPSSDILAMHLLALGRSFREPEGLDGITDCLHRMLTRGAGKWDRAELGGRLEAIGASVKTHDNDYIPYDDYYTAPEFSFVRFETLDDYFREALDILGKMVIEPRLDPEELEAVRTEMLTLVQKRKDDPRANSRVAFREVLYGPDSPAARAITGTEETLEHIQRSDLEDYHRAYFAPENLVLTVVTSVDPDEMVAEIERAFRFGSKMGAGYGPWHYVDTAPPVKTEPASRVDPLGQSQARITLGYAFDFEPADAPALRVANYLLSDRMAFQLRERQGLAYSIGSSFASWDTRGLLVADMGTRPGNLAVATEGLGAQIDSMAVAPLTDDDVTIAVSARVGRMRMRRVSRMGQAFYLSMDALRGEPLLGHETRLQELRAITPDDVRRVASVYFASDRANRVVVE